MITMLQALTAGNAVRIILTPPAGALYWRVLRRTADAFTGYNDAGAVVVADVCTDNAVLDTSALVNGTQYFYRDYTWNGTAWTDSGSSMSVTPAATFTSSDPDPQEIVRERVELGLAAEVADGNLKPAHPVKVTTAPFALRDGVSFPTVSVHLEQTGPQDRALGELTLADSVDLTDSFITETEGWLARTTLKVVGVSLNPDERIALRQAIRRVVQANLAVFDAAGMVQIEFSQTDMEQFVENNAPLYLTVGTFSCVSPAFVQDELAEVADVTVTLSDVALGSPYTVLVATNDQSVLGTSGGDPLVP